MAFSQQSHSLPYSWGSSLSVASPGYDDYGRWPKYFIAILILGKLLLVASPGYDDYGFQPKYST